MEESERIDFKINKIKRKRKKNNSLKNEIAKLKLKGKNKKIKSILFLLIFIPLFVVTIKIKFSLIWKKNSTNNDINYFNNSLQNNTLGNDHIKFVNVLPRISLENNHIPSLKEIFNSRTLYIHEANLSRQYIRYIRPINEEEELKYKKRYSEKDTFIPLDYFKKRNDQYNYVDFGKLCLEEKLIDSKKIEASDKPFISIVIPSYNKEDLLLKSIRSIQNQSFKNIEIIIVNDCSTDNSQKVMQYLLESDPRVRVFTHLQNMGVFRSRMDGILYSRGKYILLFDTGDLYEDNYVLEDGYNLMENFNLDSACFIYRIIRDYNNLTRFDDYFHIGKQSRIIYGPSNIENHNTKIFNGWGNVWNRIARANIFIKGLYLLNDYVLNIYKNLWDDTWYNSMINRVSFSFLIVERFGYVYYSNESGEGHEKSQTEAQRDKLIKEKLGFLYFDYNMLPKENNKKKIIDTLKKYNQKNSSVRLDFIKTKIYYLNNLIKLLIEDPYVSNGDKEYLKNLIIKE